MGGDMVVALGRAAVDGLTLFGHNATGRAGAPFRLDCSPGAAHAPDERARAAYLELPQARQTYTVVGARPAGARGYCHGVNEHGVAAGCTSLRTRLRLDAPGLTGPDLVRLALERGPTARQALEVLTGLVARYGQGAFPGCPAEDAADSAFLIADGREAFLVEASGRGWVCQEVREARAAGEVGTVRQDWDAIAPGLAGDAIARGWWPEDGSKLDFAGALAEGLPGAAPALRRWGRATRALEEQSGHIDAPFLRRLLSGHDEGDAEGGGAPSPCRHASPAQPAGTMASLVVTAAAVPLAWRAFGPPCRGAYLPVLPAGAAEALCGGSDLPVRLARLHEVDGEPKARAALEGLQALLDAEAAEFLAEAAEMKGRGLPDDLRRQAALFMQHAWEEFAEVADGLAEAAPVARGLVLSS